MLSVSVEEYHLFTTETLPPGMVFESEVFGEASGEEEGLLGQACRLLTHFGADGARGLGRCQCRLEFVEEGG